MCWRCVWAPGCMRHDVLKIFGSEGLLVMTVAEKEKSAASRVPGQLVPGLRSANKVRCANRGSYCHANDQQAGGVESIVCYAVFNHPPSSPDLNPNENVRSMIKRERGKLPRRPNTLNELFIAASACWHDIPQLYIENCLDGMNRRLGAVVEAGEGHTKY